MNQVGEYPIPTGDIPVIIPLLDESGLAWFAEEIKYRVDTGNDCPVIISGYPGMGKSTLAQKVARYIDPDFSNDHVHFRLDSMMEDMANMPMAIPHKRYPMAIFDESGTGLFAQEWQDPKQKKVVKIFGVNRKKGAISIFVLPGFNDLNSRLREKRIYWWCHICQDSRVAVVRRNHENQFGTDAFWRARFAFTFDRIPPNDAAWIAYEERKIKFIDDFYREDTAITYIDKRNTERLCTLLAWLKKDGRVRVKEVRDAMGITDPTIADLIKAGENRES